MWGYVCGANDPTCADRVGEQATYGRVRLPNFKVQASFRSQRPRTNSDITLVTQCSVDRRAGYIPISIWHSSD